MNTALTAATSPEDRAIDHALAQWVFARTGSSVLADAVRAASRAEGDGHSCARLLDPSRETGFDAAALAVLRQHAWVGQGQRFTPFVLDAQGRFYLWRNWQHEVRLAAAILQRCAQRSLPLPPEQLSAELDRLFAGMPRGASDWQRAAVAAAPGTRFFVLTGGPGTGKTTTVVRMLLMLLRHARACGLPERPSIALAAPTGKAAQRLVQAIAKGKAELQTSLSVERDRSVGRALPAAVAHAPAEMPADSARFAPLRAAGSARPTRAESDGHGDLGGSDFHRDAATESTPLQPLPQDLLSLLPQIPHADARTLHRLLGYRPQDNTFSRGLQQPLAEDIVVVDEASMVDLAMMRQLLEAMRPGAMLILLGDPDQLASVDAGSVLADIVASAPANRLPPALANRLRPLLQGAPESTTERAPLAGHVLTLSHSWRAGSGLQRGIEAMRESPEPGWLEALLARRSDGDLHLRHCADGHDLRTCVDAWIDNHSELLRGLLHPAGDASEALQQLRRLQILCALRDGPFGAQGVNALLARRLGARFAVDTSRPWYHGRPLIITRNDYARGLFNGDVGIALEGAEGLRVWFELSDRDGHAGLRSFSPRALPAHESAWAITIHRSQGSEYRDVAVLLPPDPDNRALNRALVYTAISRARLHAEIWSTDAALRAALAHPVQRHGGLRERLQGLE